MIDDQIKAVSTDIRESVESMHEVKRIAFEMKERLLKNDLDGVTGLFRQSWEAKKKMAASISNADIERAAGVAMDAGARAVKVSGAGGGGFMIILVNPTERLDVQRALADIGGQFVRFNFVSEGVQTWAR